MVISFYVVYRIIKLISLENIFSKIEQLRKSDLNNSELNWHDYEFGKNFYNNIARNDEQTDIETKFIAEKLRLKTGSKILDLGCGGGRNAFALERNNFKVTGIDLNKYAIEQANLNKNENLEFIHKDILDIDYQEEFNAAILIFNHFSSFNFTEAKKLLKKIEKSVVSQGKVLIEISSYEHALSLNGSQEWGIYDKWLAGDFKQLVLTDNIFNEKNKTHIRKDYCVSLNSGEISTYQQTSYIYDLEQIHEMLKFAGLKLVQIYGNWDGNFFEENDENMILLIQK